MAKTIDGTLEPYNPAGLSWIDGSLEADLPMQRLGELFNINHFIVSQVNPHARVLAPHQEGDLEDLPEFDQKLFGSFGRAVRFCRDQGRSYLKHLSNFGLKSLFFVPLGRGLVPVLVQKYSGDVTLFPNMKFSDLKTLLSNPSHEEYRAAIKEGERMTWGKLQSIRRRCMVEFMLDDCCHAMQQQVARLEEKVQRAAAMQPGHSVEANGRRISRVASYSMFAAAEDGGIDSALPPAQLLPVSEPGAALTKEEAAIESGAASLRRYGSSSSQRSGSPRNGGSSGPFAWSEAAHDAAEPSVPELCESPSHTDVVDERGTAFEAVLSEATSADDLGGDGEGTPAVQHTSAGNGGDGDHHDRAADPAGTSGLPTAYASAGELAASQVQADYAPGAGEEHDSHLHHHHHHHHHRHHRDTPYGEADLDSSAEYENSIQSRLMGRIQSVQQLASLAIDHDSSERDRLHQRLETVVDQSESGDEDDGDDDEVTI